MNSPDIPAWTAITTLLNEADAYGAKGDPRAATAHYGAALRQAARLNQWPAGMAERLAFARDACNSYGARYSSHLLGHLGKSGFTPEQASPRFTEALEIVLGRKQPFVQQPRFFYFPGLPQVQYYDTAQFAWLEALEQAAGTIHGELVELLNEPALFAPEAAAGEAGGMPAGAGEVLTCHLMKGGAPMATVAQRCTATLAAIAGAPLDYVTGRAPSAAFQLLRPGERMVPRTGLFNTRLTCWLPLMAPARCVLRVGNELREWQAGKALVFDDSIEHEAWNDSPELGAVLQFNLWRPELTSLEREMVMSLVRGIDEFDAPPPAPATEPAA
jgi:aspartyl/asparaginyl beta-hydroxylase (cupin superfamily)